MALQPEELMSEALQPEALMSEVGEELMCEVPETCLSLRQEGSWLPRGRRAHVLRAHVSRPEVGAYYWRPSSFTGLIST